MYQPLLRFPDIRNLLVQKGYCWVLVEHYPSDCTKWVKDFVPKAPNPGALPEDMEVGAQVIASSETKGRWLRGKI